MSTLVLHGLQKKSVHVDGANIIITKEAGMFNAKRENSILIRNINAVQVKEPTNWTSGYIQFVISGGKAFDATHTISGGAFDAAGDENSLVFTNEQAYEIALQIKKYVEDYTESNRSATVSTADEIRKLKALLDEGILTQAEFDAKKKQLLGI